jgi:hypothetical protein
MVSTFNLLKQLLHLVLTAITVYVHPQYMGLDLDQLEILIFGHSAEHCLQVAGKRMGEERERRWRRRVGGEEQWPVASSGVVGK